MIRRVISEGYTDAVSIARPLVANRDLPQILAIRRESFPTSPAHSAIAAW